MSRLCTSEVSQLIISYNRASSQPTINKEEQSDAYKQLLQESATLRARRKTAARGQTYNFGPLDQFLDAVTAYLSDDNNDGLESSADLGPLAANGRPPAYDTIWKPQVFDEMTITADRRRDGDRECSSLIRGGGKAQEEPR